MKTFTTSSTLDDQNVLDDLFRHMAPTIGDVVTTLMRQGKRLAQMGAMFENRSSKGNWQHD
jgi:hypothetical protein